MWMKDDQNEFTIRFEYTILNQEGQNQIRGVFKLIWSIKVAPSTLLCI